MSSIFEKWGMLYPVKLSHAEIGDHVAFPWIHPRDMLKAMAKTDDLRLLLGGFQTCSDAKGVLAEFWDRFIDVYPQHGVITKLKASVPPWRLIPVILHGDEGVTYKRHGMLLMQFSGVLGAGARGNMPEENWNIDLENCGIPLNLVKNSAPNTVLDLPRTQGQSFVAKV